VYISTQKLCHTATGNSHAIWDHTEVRIPLLPPAEAGTRFSDPRGMQSWVDLFYVKADWPGTEPRIVSHKSTSSQYWANLKLEANHKLGVRGVCFVYIFYLTAYSYYICHNAYNPYDSDWRVLQHSVHYKLDYYETGW